MLTIASLLAPATVTAAPPVETAPAEPAPVEPAPPEPVPPEPAPPEPVPPESDATTTEPTSPDAPPVEPEATPHDPPGPPEDVSPRASDRDETPVEPFAPSGTRVDIVGGSPGELELLYLDPEAEARSVGTLNGVPFVRVCTAPCTDPVSLEPGEYFVAGPKVMPSRPFVLDDPAARRTLRLHVRPGPRAIRFAGFGLVVGGALLVPGGGLLVGAVKQDPASDIAGYVFIGTGVAALAAGIALLLRGRTLVRAPDGTALSRR